MLNAFNSHDDMTYHRATNFKDANFEDFMDFYITLKIIFILKIVWFYCLLATCSS